MFDIADIFWNIAKQLAIGHDETSPARIFH